MPRHPLFNRLLIYFAPPSLSELRWSVIQVTKLGFLIHFIFEYVGQPRATAGPSMLPTIAVRGDWVWIDKSYRRGRWIKVGDVVSMKHPLMPEEGAIKRVLGMPGDFVMRDTPDVEGGRGMMIQVPEGHFWCIGDNVEASRDSRFYGPLPLALIKGKVTAKVLPLRDMRWFENTLQQPEEDP